jgi:hypothetical protein
MGDRLHEVAEDAELIAERGDVDVDGRLIDHRRVGGEGVGNLTAGEGVVGPLGEAHKNAKFDEPQAYRLVAECLAVGRGRVHPHDFATLEFVGQRPGVIVVAGGDEVTRGHGVGDFGL